jgi:TM2 domain-containing membrane protein YozV
MINQDEVFVITEDDILKPADKGKGKGGGPRAVSAGKGARGTERPAEVEETVAERPAAGARGRGRKSPAAASTLSLFICGLGQFYNGDSKLAALFFLSEVLIVAFHYFLFMTWDRIRTFAHLFFVNEWEMMLYASSIDFCVIFFLIYNVAQAYRGAEARGGRFDGLHQPITSGLASLCVPGWGQLLNGQLGKAVFFLFSFLLQTYLITLYLMSPLYRILVAIEPEKPFLDKAIKVGMGILFVTALSWLLSTYDAFIVARYTRRVRG